MPETSIRSFLRQRIARFDTDFQEALKIELEVPARKLTNKHRAVVADWNDAPTFSYRITVGERSIRLTVFPKGAARQKYRWIDKGTQPYVIRPKNAKALRFQTGYSARTRPTARFGLGSGKANGGWVSAKQVNHPGIAARGFSEKFAKDSLPEIRQIIQNAFRRATRQSR